MVDEHTYSTPNYIVLQVSFKDVILSYFTNRQQIIDSLKCGDQLKLTDKGCETVNNKSLLKFSASFMTKLGNLRSQGFVPKAAHINFIVYWKDKDMTNEIKVVLIEMELERVLVGSRETEV